MEGKPIGLRPTSRHLLLNYCINTLTHLRSACMLYGVACISWFLGLWAELWCASTDTMKRTFTENTWRNDSRFKKLCRALLKCSSEREIADFLRDVGTLAELYAWSERFDVAGRLYSGESYRKASTVTGASTTTVTRVASYLNDGEGGYQRILKSQHHHTSSPVRGEDGVVRSAR